MLAKPKKKGAFVLVRLTTQVEERQKDDVADFTEALILRSYKGVVSHRVHLPTQLLN